ncbi:MAG: hypothetical protein IGS38_19025 [Synechococcales cyanobacterium M58_A2018_015]|nr:hypothetical protein [Synechococcales cyanobacterium M58_A2018_015]
MMHLARVKTKDPEGRVQLQLLAQQKAEHAWATIPEDEGTLWLDSAVDYSEGAWVLVELTAKRQLQHIQDATPWVLEVIQQYLSMGITPTVLHEEVQRAEQWRQSLTLKSQELQRRTLEMEARREQIQELVENLKLEKERLESLAAQLKDNTNGTFHSDTLPPNGDSEA